MSVRVMSKVWEIGLPDSEKLVLLALADCANDEGHCWPSMATLSRKCSKGERTVQGAIKSLVDKGHLTRREVVGKGCNYTLHPRSDCAPTPAAAAPPQGTAPTPAAAAPPPPQRLRTNRKENHKKPSIPNKRASEISDDWQPRDFGAGTDSRKIIDDWPPDKIAFQVELFKAQHGKKGDKFVDWQKAWSTWVLNSVRFGNGNHNGHATNPQRSFGGSDVRDPFVRASIAREREASARPG